MPGVTVRRVPQTTHGPSAAGNLRLGFAVRAPARESVEKKGPKHHQTSDRVTTSARAPAEDDPPRSRPTRSLVIAVIIGALN